MKILKTLPKAMCLLLMTLTLAVSSCTKEKQSPKDTITLLQGYWAITKGGFDQNDDGAIEPAEIFPVLSELQYFFQFFADGTCNYNVGNEDILHWVINDKQTVQFTQIVNGKTITGFLKIKVLTETELQFDTYASDINKIVGSYYMKRSSM